MKPLLGSLAASAALVAAGPALACAHKAGCTVKHVHHHYHHYGPAKPKAKVKPKAQVQRPKAQTGHGGYSRGPARGDEAVGYGTSYGEGYGYVGRHAAESSYARSYSAYDVRTYQYDSGWVYGPPPLPGSPPQPPAPPPYGAGHGVSRSSYSAYGDVGLLPAPLPPHPVVQTCPHPGAVVCFPAAGSGPVSYVPAPAYGYGAVALQPETVGGLSGGVGGFESFGGFTGGRGVVIVDRRSSASAFADARAAAFASSAAQGGFGGRH